MPELLTQTCKKICHKKKCINKKCENPCQCCQKSEHADYAEMFEWLDGNPTDEFRGGYFVALEDDKIRIANSYDYIVGITSVTPAFLGDAAEARWTDKYVTDVWGMPVIEKSTEPIKFLGFKPADAKIKYKKVEKLVTNPDFDPELKYIPREDRAEWTAVGLIGKLRVEDDGSCVVGGFCRPTNTGIATYAQKGYPVLKRIDTNLIYVLVDGGKFPDYFT